MLAALAKILEQNQKSYFVTGGFAVSVWGRPRATFDIDIVMVIDEKDIRLVAKALRTLGEAMYVDEDVMKKEIRKKGEFNVIHPDSGLKVDFWVWDDKDPFDSSCLKRKITKKVRGQRVYFISPEDLILSKLRWHAQSGSERQLDDVRSVIRISKDHLDTRYLKQWAKKLNVLQILEKII